MAWENGLLDIGQFKSSGDVSTHIYKAVALSSANGTDNFVLVSARGAAVHAVLQDNSTLATANALRVVGVAKMCAGDSSAGAAIALGARVVASSKGQAVTSTAAGQHLIGIALGALGASSTGIIPVLLTIGAIST